MHVSERHDLGERLRNAPAASAALMIGIIGETCRRPHGTSARLAQLIAAGAWTDAALALIDLELPHWRVRRLAYDAGEWHCALSRQRELPDWLDQCVESRHAELALAILGAFIAAQPSRTTPSTDRTAPSLYQTVCCDNFA